MIVVTAITAIVITIVMIMIMMMLLLLASSGRRASPAEEARAPLEPKSQAGPTATCYYHLYCHY